MNALEQFRRLYGPNAGAKGPGLMVREVFGAEPDPWQHEVLEAYGKGTKRISVRSCHRVGKTTVVSWCAWHQLLTKFPQKTLATAPTAPQLFSVLYPEFMMWGSRLPEKLKELFIFKAESVELKSAPDSSFFAARTARAETPEAMQGFHSENPLILVDEASGVPESVYEAILGSTAALNSIMILTSNPTRTSGYFYNTHHKTKSRWHTVHVSHEMSPRVDRDFVEDIASTWGRDSNTFRIRCLGEFPTSEQDKIIPIDWIHKAQKHEIAHRPDMREVWGLDLARFGDDSCALVRRTKLAVLPDIQTWKGLDLMQSAGRVKAKWDETPPSQRPDEILVDEVGMGGVTDRLQELGLPARGVNVAVVASTNPDKYHLLRTELWFKARDWLSTFDKSLPGSCTCERCKREPDKDHAQQLATELSIVGFGYTSSGKKLADSKDIIKKDYGASPDVADAFVLTFAGEPATLLHGTSAKSAWSSNWNEPVTRGWTVV